MIAQDDSRRGEANHLRRAAADFLLDAFEAVEEGLDEGVKLLTRGRQREGTALEERPAEVILQREYLPADGRLLDAIRHVARGGADALMLGDVVEEFEVMDVEHGVEMLLGVEGKSAGGASVQCSVGRAPGTTEHCLLNTCPRPTTAPVPAAT